MRIIYCVPGRHYPGDKTVLAHVSDDGLEHEFRFSADIRLNRVASLAELLWREEVDGRKRSKEKLNVG